MMYRTMFPQDIFSEFDRLQRELQQTFGSESSIRGAGLSGFPLWNVGGTPDKVGLSSVGPGLDPASIEVHLERGVLTISGERAADLPQQDEKMSLHINERFTGRFRRVVSLPEDDVNPSGVTAEYRDGMLHISVKRRQAPQPRRIAIQ